MGTLVLVGLVGLLGFLFYRRWSGGSAPLIAPQQSKSVLGSLVEELEDEAKHEKLRQHKAVLQKILAPKNNTPPPAV